MPERGRLFTGITKNVFVLGVVSFLTDTSTEMIYPLLPLFLIQVLKAGPVFVGLVEGIAESTASFFRIFSGWLSDKLCNRKILIVSGYTLSGITRPLIAMAMAGWQVLIVRFIDRIGKGVRGAPRDALIADSTDPRFMGKAFGFHRSLDHAGAILGPLCAFWLLSLFPGNYRYVFWLATIPAVLCVIILILFVKEKRREVTAAPKIALSLKPFDVRFKLYLAILFIFTLGNSSDAFLLLRAKDVGVEAKFIPLLWALLHIVKMLSSTPGSAWSDKIGRSRVIILGWGIYSLIYLGFAFASNHIHIWLLFAVYGIYFGLTEGTEKALISDLVPKELRGTAYGLYSFAIGLAALPASLILGAIWQATNATIAFSFGAGTALLAMLMFLLWSKK